MSGLLSTGRQGDAMMIRGSVLWRASTGSVAMRFAVIGIFLLLIEGNNARGAAKDHEDSGLMSMQTIIHVTDFDLETEQVEDGGGLLPNRRQRSGPVRDILKKPRTALKDPAAESREIVNSMAECIEKELIKLSLNARRLLAGKAMPRSGLLIRGVFAQIDEGNRLRRAIIGFGAGHTELQLFVTVDDLAQGTPKPFYELQTTTSSRKMPGAIITMNPYVGAAKFVLSGGDLDRNIRRAAKKIASDIAERMEKNGSAAEEICR